MKEKEQGENPRSRINPLTALLAQPIALNAKKKRKKNFIKIFCCIYFIFILVVYKPQPLFDINKN